MFKDIYKINRDNINTVNYWDNKFIDGKSSNGTSACEDILEYVKNKLSLSENAVVLDIGSGSMRDSSFILKVKENFKNYKCYVSDISPEICKTWKAEGVEAVHGKLPILEFEDDYFDLILCSHVLEHVSELEEALTEIKRIAKSNSIVIINSPVGEEWRMEEEHVWIIGKNADYGIGEILDCFEGNQWKSMVQVYKVIK